jgi:CheY-like chemotaxis protein
MAKTVLFVDDEPDLQKVFKYRLNKQGYEVIEASDGKKALETLKTARPDLVLLDYRLPGMDGHEVCRRMKADPALKSIPVILMSASPGGLNQEAVAAAGADDSFVKSFEFEDLAAKIRRWIG